MVEVGLNKRRRRIVAFLVIIVFLIVFPAILYLVRLFRFLDVYTMSCCLAAFCIALYLQGIGTGRINFGPQLFWGIGGFTAGTLSKFFGFNPFLTLLGTIAIALILSSAISPLTIFLGGLYYTLITLILPYILLQLSFAYSSIFGGEEGLSGISRLIDVGVPSLNAVYNAFSAAALSIIYFLIVMIVLSSKYSLGLQAISQNENVARQIGVNVARYKITTFIVTSVMSSVIGWFTAHYYGVFLGTAYLPLNFLVKILIALMLSAGLYGIFPVVFGIQYLEEFERAILGELHHFIYPITLLVIFTILPRGIEPLLRRCGVSEIYYAKLRFRR